MLLNANTCKCVQSSRYECHTLNCITPCLFLMHKQTNLWQWRSSNWTYLINDRSLDRFWSIKWVYWGVKWREKKLSFMQISGLCFYVAANLSCSTNYWPILYLRKRCLTMRKLEYILCPYISITDVLESWRSISCVHLKRNVCTLAAPFLKFQYTSAKAEIFIFFSSLLTFAGVKRNAISPI